jgi:hypothetical protein
MGSAASEASVTAEALDLLQGFGRLRQRERRGLCVPDPVCGDHLLPERLDRGAGPGPGPATVYVDVRAGYVLAPISATCTMNP